MRVDRSDLELLAQEAEFRNIPRSELIRLAIKAAAADWRSSPDRPRPCRARGCGRAAAFKNERCVTCATAEGMTEDEMVVGALADMMGMRG